MRINKNPCLSQFLVWFVIRPGALRLERLISRGIQAIVLVLLALSVLTPCKALEQSAEQDVQAAFHAGQAALRHGDPARAVEDFKKVLTLAPNLIEAQVNLGLAYQSLLDYDAAARTLSHALSQRPNLAGLNTIVGMDYIKLGSPEKAAPYLQRAVKLDPASPDVHDAMALYDLTQKNFQGAAEQYRKSADLNADKAEALFKIGHQYLDLAVRLAYQGARLYPESSWGHRFLGDTLFERDRWEDAGREYEKALAIEPRQAGLHSLLGEVRVHNGKLDDAESEFRRELQLDSRSERAWLGLATLQLVRGRAPEALASVSTVWKSSPDWFEKHSELPLIGISKETAQDCILQLQGQPEQPAKRFILSALYAEVEDNQRSDRELQAFQSDLSKWQLTFRSASQAHQDSCKLHQYVRCIATLQGAKPLTSSSYLILGRSYFTMQRYDRAAEALANVRGDQGAHSEASYWLERTFQAMGAQSFAQLETSFPDSWRTHQLRAEGFALRQDHDNAVKEFEAAIGLRPDEAELHEALGEFYLDNQSETQAQEELEKAASLDHSRTKTLYLLGRLYIDANQDEKAVPFLRRALQLQPNLNEADSLLGTALIRMGDFADAVPRLEKAAPLDHAGNIHYQLYQAYRKLGQADLAQQALTRSQEIRRNHLEHDQALIMGPHQPESDPK